MPKYRKRQVSTISSDSYQELKDKRGIKVLKATRTVDFKELQGIEVEILTEHVWSYGDKLFNLSLKYYGDIKYWWIIGILNKKPTDGHYSIGDVVYIPRNPQQIDGRIQ